MSIASALARNNEWIHRSPVFTEQFEFCQSCSLKKLGRAMFAHDEIEINQAQHNIHVNSNNQKRRR